MGFIGFHKGCIGFPGIRFTIWVPVKILEGCSRATGFHA